ncbi:copper chaperone PCu(A)C [Ornithinimicrobium sp. W1665]|uniref:copper chaperone PCu(A)C n=1 Tax=Ornithinimicrobium sp. W1665 TaxID=3416666 RepID=UPI003CF518F4
MPIARSARSALVLTLALAVTLTGCGPATGPADAPPATPDATSAGAGLVLVDGWAKATDGPMTGVFGALTNDGGTDLHLVEVRSELAGTSEMHVTVDDGAGGRVMRRAEDGFVVPAGGEHALEPGGDHLMLMQLAEPVGTGQEVDLVVVDSDGVEHELTVTARAFSGAEEDYAPGEHTEAP